MKLTPVGLDFGNSSIKIGIDEKFAKIPSRYAFEAPPGAISAKTGQELKPVAFSLVFDSRSLWFGQDVLGSGSIQKIGMAKYDPEHISILFRAALYQWSRAHKIDLAALGKLNVVCSMPPGLYQKPALNKIGLTAFRKAFNRGQSHAKIRDGQASVQIVSQFGGLIREAVAWGQAVPRQGEMVLTADLGGGTNDYVLFNSSPEPLATFTDNAGLIHAFSAMDPIAPGQAELKVLRSKSVGPPHQLITYFNEVERRIQLITLRLPRPVDRLYIIGGGAALMTPKIKATFTPLAGKVIFKDEFANAEANWRYARGSDGNSVQAG